MNTSSREKQACTASSRVAVPGVVTTFSFSSPARCCLHWTPKRPVSQEKQCLTPALLGQPAPGASLRKEQWIAKTKVTCSKGRPARGPASHLGQTLGTGCYLCLAQRTVKLHLPGSAKLCISFPRLSWGLKAVAITNQSGNL